MANPTVVKPSRNEAGENSHNRPFFDSPLGG